MEKKTENKKSLPIKVGYKAPAYWVSLVVTSAVIAALMGWFFWLAKARIYGHSFSVLFAISAWAIAQAIAVKIISYIFEESEYSYRGDYKTDILPIIFIVLAVAISLITLLGGLFSSPLMRSKGYYAKVAENVTVIKDSDEVSAFPNLLGSNNDTSNLPLIGVPEAIKKAETEMGRFPALGSQFELVEKDMTSQSINGELCYVIPLQPKSMFKWSGEGNHGYFIIDRNNGKTTFVETSLHTTTSAPFGDSTKRVINSYLNGIGVDGLVTDISPEVDDDGNFHYVGTVYTIDGIGGMKHVKGIVEVNAEDKSCKYYDLDEIPEYVDRVFPESFFEDYLGYYGNYKNGFWNSVIGQKEVQEQTADMDVIYIDGICYYYTGWTSAGKGESSNGIMMMNSRTGAIELHTTYGISEEKAQGVAEGIVQEKEYTASYPLLLQVAGQETYFMLMRDMSENLVGYAFVSYKDYTKAAVGTTLMDAQANYVKSVANSNSTSSLDESLIVRYNSVITDITSEVVDGNTIYYVKIEASDTIFQMTSKLDVQIVFAKVGDGISLKYYDSGNKLETAIECTITPKAE